MTHILGTQHTNWEKKKIISAILSSNKIYVDSPWGTQGPKKGLWFDSWCILSLISYTTKVRGLLGRNKWSLGKEVLSMESPCIVIFVEARWGSYYRELVESLWARKKVEWADLELVKLRGGFIFFGMEVWQICWMLLKVFFFFVSGL